MTIYSLDVLLSQFFEPVCCSISDSSCYFLACIQVSQEACQVVWHSHLFKNFPQFVVSHTIKSFGIVNKAEIDIFLELSCFFKHPMDVLIIQQMGSLNATRLTWKKFKNSSQSVSCCCISNYFICDSFIVAKLR